MEELLIAILQFVFETLAEAAIYWPFESSADRMLEANPSRESVPLTIAAIAGAVVGGISLVVWPYTWLHFPALRMANLVLAPLISAGGAWLTAVHRNPQSAPAPHAWFGFTFTLAFVLVRFTWGVR